MSLISDENALTGTPQATWDVTGVGSTTIHGFARQMSVAQGQTLQFAVHSASSAWSGDVYRLGWYGGDGARDVGNVSGPQTAQPNGVTDAATGMVSCANWLTNGSWSVPADACPGVYIIKIRRTDNTSLASHVGPFVVRDPGRKAPLAVKTSDTTWQAYNSCGANPATPLTGSSIYGSGTAAAWTWWQAGGIRTRAVSYDRPIMTRHHHPQTTIWGSEYPMIRWLERCGYDLDYVSSLDVDADPSLLLGREAVMSSGHDEYWSPGIRDAFIEARDAGVHLLFATANEAFWRINLASGRREYACWKDTHDGALNSTGVYSGTWQDTRGFNPDRRPAALLVGQRFRRNGIAAHALTATSAHAGSPFWRDTPVAALAGASTWASGAGIVGFEGDEPADLDPTETPAGLIRLSAASFAVSNGLSDDDGNEYDLSGTYTHAMTVYRASSGAVVWGAGTNQFAWGLDDVHDRTPNNLATDVLRQALTNLLADVGVAPGTLPGGLVDPTPADLDNYGSPESVMANSEFDTFNEGILAGEIDLDTAVIKCALVRGYTFSAAHKFVSDVTGAGGVINGTSAALANKSVTNGVFDADDTSVSTTANASNHGLLVFQSSAVGGGADVAASAQRVIAYYDTGTGLPIQPGTGTVSVTWSSGASKILKVG